MLGSGEGEVDHSPAKTKASNMAGEVSLPPCRGRFFLGLALAEQHWDALPLKKETVTPTRLPPKLGTVVG